MRYFSRLLIALTLLAGITSCASRAASRPASVPPPVLTVKPAPQAIVAYESASVVPPKPLREFRAAWVPSVGENSWLVLAGTNTARQKATILAMMDRAADLKLNALIFQVRPACDALYLSKVEPWSEHLTGTMGKAPWPYYDPLTFAIEEAHKRGIELHAWFNPYRALHPSAKSRISLSHIARRRPDLIRTYGSQYWLDPGERDVQDYSLSVIMDVVKRYDIDGIHFDDYFYPYPETNSVGKIMDFPDTGSWRKFGVNRGLNRDDWRRENVNSFVQRVYYSIKTTKPWVQFGIGPFGIWRRGVPAQIKGLDAYAILYADARKWLVNGWVDYMAPQLYWAIEPPAQSFPVLLKWWAEQNTAGRIIVAGMSTANVGLKWNAEEILQQIEITRREPGVYGQVHWNLNSFMRSDALTAKMRALYSEPALVPISTRSPGFDARPPLKPIVFAHIKGTSVKVSWSSPTNQVVAQWVVQVRNGGGWSTEILAANQTARAFAGGLPEVIAVAAVSRFGVLSEATVVGLRK